MTKKPNGWPAFPRGTYGDQEGMTLRDWFAGQALAGLAATNQAESLHEYAKAAYKMADAMIAARDA